MWPQQEWTWDDVVVVLRNVVREVAKNRGGVKVRWVGLRRQGTERGISWGWD